MSRSPFTFPAVVAAAALMWGAPAFQSVAFSPDRTGQNASQQNRQDAVQSTYDAVRPAATINLSPIVVKGHRVPLPIALQLIKKGLQLPWTNDLNDTRLRCRIHQQTGTHFRAILCEGNRHHMIRTERLHTQLLNAMAIGHGSVPAINAAYSIPNASTLMPLLKKLPPANTSYTLRITGDEGQPLVEYVIKDGNLTHVYRYVYEHGKAEKAEPH